MERTDLIARYRRSLKRRNYSVHTVKNYINILSHFNTWLQIPVELVTSKETDAYMEHLLRRRKKPKTINCHFGCIHAFYEYLIEDEGMLLVNPVRKNYRLRLPRPLPKHLRDTQVEALFKEINDGLKQVGGDDKDGTHKKKEKSGRNCGEDSLLLFEGCLVVCVQTIHLNQCFLAL